MAAAALADNGRMTATERPEQPRPSARHGSLLPWPDVPPWSLVRSRPRVIRQPLCWVRLRPADRPLVRVGQRVSPGDQIAERIRDPVVVERRLPNGFAQPKPGELIERERPLGGDPERGPRFDGGGRVLYAAPGRRLRVAIGRHGDAVGAPVGGVIEIVGRTGVAIRADGIGVPGTYVAGAATHGRLAFAVPNPGSDLRASAIDVSSEGTVLVAGARLDVEALPRARAMGVRGIVVGGVIGRDLRAFAASEARQRAALHTSLAFGLCVLDGYGRRPRPGPGWGVLQAATRPEVGLVWGPPVRVVDAAVAVPVEARDRVRVAGGEYIGREGRILAVAGDRRFSGGVHGLGARVLLDREVAAGGPEEVVVPIADLERFD